MLFNIISVVLRRIRGVLKFDAILTLILFGAVETQVKFMIEVISIFDKVPAFIPSVSHFSLYILYIALIDKPGYKYFFLV